MNLLTVYFAMVVLSLSLCSVFPTKFFSSTGEYKEVQHVRKAINAYGDIFFASLCADGLILMSCQLTQVDDTNNSVGTRLLDEGMSTFNCELDNNLRLVASGIKADCTNIVRIAREKLRSFKSRVQVVSGAFLADSLSEYLNELTLTDDTRPLAVQLLLLECSSSGNYIFAIDCDGSYDKYNRCVIPTLSEPSNEIENDRDNYRKKLVSQLRKLDLTIHSCEESENVIRSLVQALNLSTKIKRRWPLSISSWNAKSNA